MSGYAVFELEDGTKAVAPTAGGLPPSARGSAYRLRIDGVAEEGFFVENTARRPFGMEEAVLLGGMDVAGACQREEDCAFSRQVWEAVMAWAGERARDIAVLRVRTALKHARVTILLSLTSRVDLHGLKSALDARFATDVRIRSVSPRGAAALIGGMGLCGRRLCCSQGLAGGNTEARQAVASGKDLRDPALAGPCGRLRCCYRFEPAPDTPRARR